MSRLQNPDLIQAEISLKSVLWRLCYGGMGYKAANCTATQYQSTGVPAFLLLIQLTGDVLGKAVEDLPSMREATKHMDDQAEALGPWHQLGPNLAMATI